MAPRKLDLRWISNRPVLHLHIGWMGENAPVMQPYIWGSRPDIITPVAALPFILPFLLVVRHDNVSAIEPHHDAHSALARLGLFVGGTSGRAIGVIYHYHPNDRTYHEEQRHERWWKL